MDEPIDLMLVTATEDIDKNQIFFERKNNNKLSNNRLLYEYELDEWDIFRRTEGDFDEENRTSNRQRAIRRISELLEKIPSNSEKSSVGKT